MEDLQNDEKRKCLMQGELDPVRQVEIQVSYLLNPMELLFLLVEIKKLLDQDVKKCWVVSTRH